VLVSFAYFAHTRIIIFLFINQLKQASDSQTVVGKLYNACFGYNYVVVFVQFEVCVDSIFFPGSLLSIVL
jgi:hypothetical protein